MILCASGFVAPYVAGLLINGNVRIYFMVIEIFQIYTNRMMKLLKTNWTFFPIFAPQSTLERWQIVFYIAAGVYVVNTIIYLFFASSEEQPWNREAVVPRLQARSTDNLLPIPEDPHPQAVTSDEEATSTEHQSREADIIRAWWSFNN